MKKSLLDSRPFLVVALLFSLPVLLFIYQPTLQLGAFGMLLGVIGMTLSPLFIFGILLALILRASK